MYSVTVTDNSEQVLQALKKARTVALASVGQQALAHAKATVPVDTGRLRDSLACSLGDGKVSIGTNVSYGPSVELGGRSRAGTHFLRDSIALYKEAYGEIIRAAMKGGGIT